MKRLYHSTLFTAQFGDIAESSASAVAVPSSPDLTMDGGIAKIIKEKGGDSIEREAQRYAPCDPGSVIATTAGTLRTSSVFHCVLLDRHKKASYCQMLCLGA